MGAGLERQEECKIILTSKHTNRMINAKCKICRRAEHKLFLRGERCFSAKCAMIKRPYPPGKRIKRRKSISEYGKELKEKQTKEEGA